MSATFPRILSSCCYYMSVNYDLHWGTGQVLSPTLGDRSGPAPNVGGRSVKNLSSLSKQFTVEYFTCFWVKGKNGRSPLPHLKLWFLYWKHRFEGLQKVHIIFIHSGFVIKDKEFKRLAELWRRKKTMPTFVPSLINFPVHCLWPLLNCLAVGLAGKWPLHHNHTFLNRFIGYNFRCIFFWQKCLNPS